MDLNKIPTYGWQYFLQNNSGYRLTFFLLTLAGAFSTLIGFYTTYLLSDVINNITTVTTHSLLVFYLPMYVGLYFLSQCFGWYTRKYGEMLPTRYTLDHSVRFFEAVSHIKSDKFNNYQKEKLQNAIDKYLLNASNFLQDWNWQFPRNVVSFILVMIILFMQSPLIFGINFIYIAIFMMISLTLSRKIALPIRKYHEQYLETTSLRQNFFLNVISIKRLRKNRFFTELLAKSSKEAADKGQAFKDFHAKRWFIQLNMFNLIYVSTFFYAVYQIINKELPLGYIVLIQYCYGHLMTILIYFLEYYVTLINQKQDALILKEELAKITIGADFPKPMPIVTWNSFNLTNMSYSFSNAKGEQVDIGIQKFDVAKGDKIVITGESGSGKSTLLAILMGQIRGGENGYYSVDGNPVMFTNFTKKMELINNNDAIFNMSMAENIVLGDYVDHKQFDLLYTKLRVKEFLTNFDAVVGHENFNLSSGQLQRIRLFRGLLRDKEIYLLDEAFNGIDSENKRQIREFLQEYLRDKTVIEVVHNPEDLIFTEARRYDMGDKK